MIKSLKTEEIKTKEDVLKALEEYLQDAIELSQRKCRDETNFTVPAWSEFQAYQLGMQKAYTKILDLFKP
jgi:hypothetical protein